MTNRKLLAQNHESCNYACECKDCYIHEQCLKNIQSRMKLRMDELFMRYPVGKEVTIYDEDTQETVKISGYEIYNGMQIIIMNSGRKINLECMERKTKL